MFGGELPVVDEARCTRSGNCVAACPTRCLELRGGQPWLARPADCLSCGACVAVCPVGAIRLETGMGSGAKSPPAAAGGL